jgi:hypothetical protein
MSEADGVHDPQTDRPMRTQVPEEIFSSPEHQAWLAGRKKQDPLNPSPVFEPLLEDLMHTRSCPSLIPGHEEDCTCGLVWRIRLRTEMEMRNAWEKRAYEAEARLISRESTI